MTGGPATIGADGHTKVGVRGSGKVEVNKVEGQMERLVLMQSLLIPLTSPEISLMFLHPIP